MIAFFDTSAIIPLVIAEQGTARAQAAWRAASRVHVIAPTAAEAQAALAAALRAGRLDGAAEEAARRDLDRLLDDCACRSVDLRFARTAGQLALEHGLRGYDAMQCMGPLDLDEQVVGVAGDRALLDAWARLGVPTVDVLAA